MLNLVLFFKLKLIILTIFPSFTLFINNENKKNKNKLFNQLKLFIQKKKKMIYIKKILINKIKQYLQKKKNTQKKKKKKLK